MLSSLISNPPTTPAPPVYVPTLTYVCMWVVTGARGALLNFNSLLNRLPRNRLYSGTYSHSKAF